MKKLNSVLSRFADASGLSKDHHPSGGQVEDMSDAAFRKRHRQLEKDEAQIREEER
jgi:hypothetical protein